MSSQQEAINKLEWEIKNLTEEMKRLQVLISLVGDCKLKFQQIKRKEESICAFENQEGSEDVVQSLYFEKERSLDLISKNKDKIEEIDTFKTAKGKPLHSVRDCEKLVSFLKDEFKGVSAKHETCTLLKTSLSQQLKLDIIAKQEKVPEDQLVAKYSGEWNHTIPLSKFTGGDSLRMRTTEAHSLPCARFLTPLYAQQDLRITYCDLLHNSAHLSKFYAALETCEKRHKTGLFAAHLERETDELERQHVLDELVYKSPFLATHSAQDAGVLVMGVFHGTSAEIAETIVEVGFANMGSRDGGWFGDGIYFTPQPEYAAMYCKDNPNPCLIFCYVILANPYPVVFSDASSTEEQDLRFYSQANYRNYGCHFVPVVHYGGPDFRPPNPAQIFTGPMYNEIVIFQETHILPHAIVYFENV